MPPTFEIAELNRCDPAHLAAISALARATYTEAFGESMTAEDLADILANTLSPDAFKLTPPTTHALVARDGEKLLGYIQFSTSGQALGYYRPTPAKIPGLSAEDALDSLITETQFVDEKFPKVSIISQVAPAAQDGVILRLYVLSAFQNVGVGAALMKAALDFLADCPRVFLDVWARNDRAIRFYERFGFQIVGEKSLILTSGPAEDPDLVMMRPMRLPATESL